MRYSISNRLWDRSNYNKVVLTIVSISLIKIVVGNRSRWIIISHSSKEYYLKIMWITNHLNNLIIITRKVIVWIATTMEGNLMLQQYQLVHLTCLQNQISQRLNMN
jgi:hypothetical protein